MVIAVLRTIERHGLRTSAVVCLAGLVTGAGVVELAAGPLGQSSRFSLDLLMQLELRFVGPLVVSVLAVALLVPLWLERLQREGSGCWRRCVPAAAVLAPLLQLQMLLTSVLGGTLISPRADLAGELRELAAGLDTGAFALSLLRAAVFLGLTSAWLLRQAARELERGQAVARIASDLTIQGLVILFLCKLIWILAFPL